MPCPHHIFDSNLCSLNTNSLPDNKINALFKLKVFANNKLNGNQNVTFVFHKVENMMRKGEDASFNIFSFSNNVFKGVRGVGCQYCAVKS